MINKTVKYLVVIITCIAFSPGTASQENSMADEYYNDNIQTALPSESYYNKNLRAGGWDDDDPSGSGEGDNTGVGNTPIGSAGYSLFLGMGIYCFWIFRKKIKQVQ